MTRRLRAIPTVLCAACLAGSCSRAPSDLSITHASLLDTRTLHVSANHTIHITNGIITAVLAPTDLPLPASQTIDAHDRLLTPGLIDAHLHLCNLFPPPCTGTGDHDLHLSLLPHSVAAYRRVYANLYLPYGVTAVRDAGSDERALPLLLAWSRPSPDAPDFHPSGAQLISPDPNHVPAPWQVEVADSAAAAKKVRDYHALGIRNIKLYWRLREPAFQGALLAALSLGMNVTGHVDFGIVPIDRALALGLRNFEHVTWAESVLDASESDSVYQRFAREVGPDAAHVPGAFFLMVPEYWHQVGPNDPRLLSLVIRLKQAGASVTPTLHVFAERLGLTYFQSPPRDSTKDTSRWPPAIRARAVAGYRIMASYVTRLFDAGVQLNTGTDAPDPGQSILSEMLLLHDAGIPMSDVFRIATLNTARAIGHEAEYGSIEVGKRANLILFDGDPLAHPRDLLGGKTVIKDGVVYRQSP